ncbi:MAG: PAS domain S-box protein [bacterium]|nr:PAS domain S-box protein [bacterium]
MKFYPEQFKKYRKSKRYSMEHLAQKVGITRVTLWAWEKGKRVPSKNKIIQLAKILDIDVSCISDIEIIAPTIETNFTEVATSWLRMAETTYDKHQLHFDNLMDGLNLINKELKQTKLLIDTLLMSVNATFYIKDTESRYVIANKSFLESLSYGIAYRVMGKKDIDFFPTREARSNEKQDEEVLASGQAVMDAENYIPGSRKKKWGLISKIPITNAKGNTVGLLGMFVDITERKKSERFKELLDSIISETSDAIWIETYSVSNKEFIYISKSIENITGYSFEQFKKKGISFLTETCIHPKDREYYKNLLTEYNIRNFELNRKKYNNKRFYTCRIVKPDGSIRWIEEVISVHEFFNTKCICFLIRDITEKKEKEEFTKDLLTSSLNAFPDGYVITNNDELFFNKAFEKIVGYARSVILSDQNIWLNKCVHSDDFKKEEKYFKEQAYPEIRHCKIIHGTNHEIRKLELRTFKFKHNSIAHTATILKDITD